MASFAVHSPKSEATVALALIPGSALMVPVIIGSSFLMADGLYNFGETQFTRYYFGINGHVLNGFLGILIFDKESNEVELREITLSDAKAIGLRNSEAAAYNSELGRINLALSEMNSTLSNTAKENLENVRGEVLTTFQSEISSEAFSAVQKIMKKTLAK